MGTHSSTGSYDNSGDNLTRKQVAALASELEADCSKGFLVGVTSAGANIAAAVSHLAHDEEVSPPLTGVFLTIPNCLPHDAVPDKYRDKYGSFAESKDYVAGNPEAMLEVMDEYLLAVTEKSAELSATRTAYYQGDRSFPLCAPFNWPSGHKDLPRTYIQVCGMDPLRDEGLLYEYVLRTEVRVQTKLDFYPGMPHGCWVLYPPLETAKKATANAVKD